MSSSNENINEIKEKLKSIENRLKKLERGSLSDLEHQLFFGVIFSLLILFVTIEPSQIADFFQNIGFPQDGAMKTAISIKTWGAILTFLSAIMRYYSASVKDEIRKSQRWRLLSILSTLISFELFLFFLVMNITFPLPVEFGWMNLPLEIISLFAIYLFIAYFIEKRLLSFYASKKLILKKHIEPIVSRMFTLVMFTSYFAVFISLIVFLWVGLFSTEVFMAIFTIGCLLLLFPKLRKWIKRIT